MELICEILWQWSGLALVAWCMLRVLRWSRASVRYAVLWASIAAAVALPLLRRIPADPETAVAAGQVAPAAYSFQFSLPSSVDFWARAAAGVWLLVAVLLLLRLALGVRATFRLRAKCTAAPESVLRRLQVPIGRRGYPGELLLCDEVAIPSVLGLLGPAIVMSRRLVDSLSDDELDQVLLHEWAHIERRDQWAKLAQGVIESLWFFHPAMWWFSRNLNREREVACDEWVTSQTCAPRVYASALTAVAQFLVGAQRLGMAPQTAASRGEITRRVERLLRSEGRKRMPLGWSWAAAALLFAAGAAVVHHSTPEFTTEGTAGALLSEIAQTGAQALAQSAPAPVSSPAPMPRARASRRAQATPSRRAAVTPAAAAPGFGEPARTEIAAVPAGELESQPRYIRLDALLINTAQPGASSPTTFNQDRTGGIDLSGFHILATSLARGGKGTGGFFQKLAATARNAF